MQYKIIVDKQSRTNPSSEKKEYIIDIEELRVKGDVYDSLIITKDEDYVMRRLSLSKYNVLSVLGEPIKEPIPDLNIELFEGDNYIYLMDMVGNRFYAEYLVKNDFTDIYVTRNEMNSYINQSASQIELSVNQKLTGYSTTQEMNSAIELQANQIKEEVSNTYATQGQLQQERSERIQTANSITETVEKKVDEETITGAYLILKINGDTSETKLNSDKINLIANDILNAIAGNAINLTSKNITISSTNFNVDKNGNMTCKNGNFTGGYIELSSTGDNGVNTGDVKFKVKKDTNNYIDMTSNSVRIFANDFENWVRHGWMRVKQLSTGEFTAVTPAFIQLTDPSKTTHIRSDGIDTPTLTQTSLKSKKKNIKKLNTNAVELIKNSDICLYNLKGEKAKSKKHIGLVIGEGYNCPEEVISEDGQGVEQYSMTSLAWKAIQEQQEIIESLNNRIEKLEAK